MNMAKIVFVLFALCVAPSIVTAKSKEDSPLLLKGRVYCDTCRCGYETSASTPLPRAVVGVECRSRKSSEVTFRKEVVTDSTGHYQIFVHGDRGDDMCDALLVKSSDPECSTPNAGRDRARVILTRNNGMNSNTRFANAMGFLKNTALDSCQQILQQYQETESED
ncbi:pollen allergen Sal k 5.0101-like [Andrographis paniculata]|uniref:pollen allergen Sal k 5.0101-like n=1 Tax=Andrographis paniculata TaxID=175694 RepID=UPI0021E79C48|nr:pollen allergen Sal k 5.0101-like [Andrographis paniculata]